MNIEQMVAIIMRTKDRPLFLRRAIQSVIQQTYDGWILVIVNDGGDSKLVDEVLEEYHQYREKIILVNNEKSLGMEAASNKGINAVKSKYLVIHDDDDTWESTFLNTTINYLEANPSCYGVITYSNKIIEKIEGDQIRILKRKPFNYNLKGMVGLYEICEKNLFSPISFVYQRVAIQEIGLYDENLPVLGDWEFNLRFIQKYDIHIIEEGLANYHHRTTLKKGNYSNSIIGGKDKHLYYEIQIKNKLLRKDIEQGKLGIGTIINLGKGIKKSNSITSIRDKLRQVMR